VVLLAKSHVVVQWLMFRNDGTTTAGRWAQDTAQYGSNSNFSAESDRGKEQGQLTFISEILRQTKKVDVSLASAETASLTLDAGHAVAGVQK